MKTVIIACIDGFSFAGIPDFIIDKSPHKVFLRTGNLALIISVRQVFQIFGIWLTAARLFIKGKFVRLFVNK